MEKGDPEMGLQHLAQAAQLAQLLQRAAAQRVPITLPNAQEDLELGAAHMASIVLAITGAPSARASSARAVTNSRPDALLCSAVRLASNTESPKY